MTDGAKKNVLVFPCGTEIGLEINRSLSHSTHFTVFGGSSVDDHGRFVYPNYIGDLPFVDADDFVDKINAVIEAHNIDFIVPAHDSVLVKLAAAAAEGKLSCTLVASPVETCETTRSKSKTYAFFKDKITVPKVYQDVSSLAAEDFPVFLKPDVGQGSKGTHLAKTPEEVRFYLVQNPNLLVLEYLPGKEYTIDCFTNNNGDLLFSEGRERCRIQNGISVNSVTVSDDRFAGIANKINSALTLRGAWFFQVKENAQSELVLMEIASRIAGTMGLVRCKGVNLSLLSLFDAMGVDVSIIENPGELVIDRALENRYHHDWQYEHVYLDFDDLVIFEGKVNPQVMAFVYQCLNKGITIHLLTKHKADLQATLTQYRLESVFENIIHIDDSEEKYPHITESQAIFIDDSYAERSKVLEHCHIPVFDSHMLESLMEVF